MVAKRMNRTLLEKVRYMLSSSRWSKSFWAEALMYSCLLINRSISSAIGGETLMEVCLGKPAQDYNSLRIFGFPIYYYVEEDKLDP